MTDNSTRVEQLTPEAVERLEAVARKTSSGPWFTGGNHSCLVLNEAKVVLADTANTSVMDHIVTFDPPTCLALIADRRADAERIKALEGALGELVAMVRGEAPSLLDEDSGGTARLDLEIDRLLNPTQERQPMTDTPTRPAATGSQAQEREALLSLIDTASPVSYDGIDTLSRAEIEFIADRILAAGWTRRPSGAGEVSGKAHPWGDERNDPHGDVVRRVTESFAADVKRIMGPEPEADALEGSLTYDQQLRVMVELNGWQRRAETAEATLAALSLRGDAETDAPAVVEPQAVKPKMGDQIVATVYGRLHDGSGDVILSGTGKPGEWVRADLLHDVRPTPATPAPASAPAVGGEEYDLVTRLIATARTCNASKYVCQLLDEAAIALKAAPPPRADAAADAQAGKDICAFLDTFGLGWRDLYESPSEAVTHLLHERDAAADDVAALAKRFPRNIKCGPECDEGVNAHCICDEAAVRSAKPRASELNTCGDTDT